MSDSGINRDAKPTKGLTMATTAKVDWDVLLEKAVTEPGTISEAYTRFHNYSVGNQLLAMVQADGRTGPINTYKGWLALGRQVRKGEKAIQLCMPVTAKGKKKDQPAEGDALVSDERETVRTFFIYRNNWFFLSSTDGDAVESQPVPGWDRGLAIKALDVKEVAFMHTDGNVQGYANARTFAINPVADAPDKTTFHELAHIQLGHTAEAEMSDSHERTPRDIRELEAEAVALICVESLGLPGASDSRGYIQNWYTGNTVPVKSARRIFSAAQAILKAGHVSAEV